MVKSTDPIIDQWYHSPHETQQFMVTAIEDASSTIEIQYFDGTIDEFEFTTWYAMEVEPVAAPEDWTGPMDNIELDDDFDQDDSEVQSDDWSSPYEE
ncbi:MAG: hypothetical protein OEN02_07575 [Gammaproteobacteria bacterium]|nr:hypothetical protein [Gammaproteobacteria bacterium]MDH3538276.1 hypothetical protein [Gammaproteobacteria bacterium]